MITLVFCLYLMPGLFAQKIDYGSDSKWFWGINVGAAWNSTDVENETNAGWGLTLGRSFNYATGKLTSFDLRLRYLGGNWYGQDYETTDLSNYNPAYMPDNLQDYKDNPGFTVNNFNSTNHELGLELVLHANRLRERTGWDPYIFGGANLVWNQTQSDLVNFDSSFFGDPGQYNYDPTFINEATINGMLDGVYETPMNAGSENLDYNLNFMPSLGVGLGYYFGPRWSLGVEHKTTFTLKDDWDGYEDATPGLWGLSNDIYHYTGGYLRFHFRGGRGEVTPPNNNLVDCPEPVIRLIRPSVSGTTVDQQVYAFRTEISNISGVQNVKVRVNGIESTNFFYSTTTRMLEGSIVLNQGANQIQIVATNSCGTDVETVAISYEDCRTPIVTFTQPTNNNMHVDRSQYTVRASIANGGSVNYSVNGTQSSNFYFSVSNGKFESNLTLVPGANTIRIAVTNECGADVETITIIYSDCEDPQVSFLAGNGSVMNVSTPTATINATITGIQGMNAIGFRVNGANKLFSFNTNSQTLESTISLNPGSNRVQITAGNDCGTDTEILTINYTPCVAPNASFITPSGTVNTTGVQQISALVSNANNVNQIKMYVNGVSVAGGSFNVVTNTYTNNAPLNSGSNTIQIVVTSSCGSDSQTINVIYDAPCPNPVISLATAVSNTHQSNIQIQYVIQNVTSGANVQLMLNGSIVNGGSFNTQTNVYTANLNLQQGANSISIIATNACGSDNESVIVSYTPPCDDPVISMINPIGSSVTVTSPTFNVQAMLQNVTNTGQIQLSVNGVNDNNGTYNSVGSIYRNGVNLQNGANVIVLTVNNGCGTVTETFVINYSPCLQPVVAISSPTTGSTQSGNAVVTATVLNVNNVSGIELISNGSVYSGSYNTTTGLFQSNIPLQNGANSIQIIATNDCGSVSQSVVVNFQPCESPEVQILAPQGGMTMTQPTVVQALVTGVSNASEISLTINGSVVNGSYNASTNMFTANVTLTSGLNTIIVSAANDCGSDNASTVIRYSEPCNAPQVTIQSPQNAAVSNGGSVQLTASVQNVTSASEVSVTVNGNAVTGGTLNGSAFTVSVPLSAAQNTIVVTASNSCGSSTQSVTVTTRPCLAPTIQLVAPQANVTQSSTVNLQATITGITSTSQVNLTVNGNYVTGTYNASTNSFTATVTLNEGSNSIVLNATNNCGTDNLTKSITYNAPCNEPTIQLTSPLAGAAQNQTVNVQATVMNVSSASQINLTVNGSAVNGAYNASTHVFTASINLSAGSNTIAISATNECGTDNEQVVMTYENPCEAPVIQITAPTGTSNTQQTSVQATVTNVSSASQINLTVNGTAVQGSYNAATNVFVAAVNLNLGLNSIILNASNDCGFDTKNIRVRYEVPCVAPNVSITAPQNGDDISTTTTQFTANVQNVSLSSQITVTHNGANVTGGFFNSTTGLYTATLTFTEHVNTIVISVTNDCGSDSQNIKVQYDEPKITICHHPPGNPTNTQEIEIPLSAWPAHQAHGDTQGPCPTGTGNGNGNGNGSGSGVGNQGSNNGSGTNSGSSGGTTTGTYNGGGVTIGGSGSTGTSGSGTTGTSGTGSTNTGGTSGGTTGGTTGGGNSGTTGGTVSGGGTGNSGSGGTRGGSGNGNRSGESEETIKQKAAEEAAKKKAAEEAAKKKAAEDAAKKRAAEEAAKKAQEEAQRQAAIEAAKKKAAEEAAKKAQEDAKRKAATDAAKKKAAEEAAKKKAAEEAAKKKLEEEGGGEETPEETPKPTSGRAGGGGK